MSKIGFLITARLKSERLPFKLLKDLNGKTVLERVIERAKEVKGISEVVVCTSTNAQDDPIVDVSIENQVHCFRGSEDDVLNRLLMASKQYEFDYVVSITADNPLFTIDYSNRIVDEMQSGDYDYVVVNNLPLGVTTHGLKIKALETVCNIKAICDTEIWGHLIDRTEVFSVKHIEPVAKLKRPELRLTLDYQEDYDLFQDIYSNVAFNDVIHVEDVIDYLDTHPDVKAINESCVQKSLGKGLKDKIDNLFKDNLNDIKKIKNEIYSR